MKKMSKEELQQYKDMGVNYFYKALLILSLIELSSFENYLHVTSTEYTQEIIDDIEWLNIILSYDPDGIAIHVFIISCYGIKAFS